MMVVIVVVVVVVNVVVVVVVVVAVVVVVIVVMVVMVVVVVVVASVRACHCKSGPGEFGPGRLNYWCHTLGNFVRGTTFPGEYGPWSVNLVRVTFPWLVETMYIFYC